MKIVICALATGVLALAAARCLAEEQPEIGRFDVVPVDDKAPDRFSKRYEFLTFVCRQAWVDWRCRKIRELFGRIRKRLAESRADLRVTVTLWDETTVPSVLGAERDLAEAFHEAWVRRVGAGELIYTRRAGGREVLLAARGRAFSNQFVDPAERLDRWQ